MVTVYDFGRSEEGLCYIAMELLRGICKVEKTGATVDMLLLSGMGMATMAHGEHPTKLLEGQWALRTPMHNNALRR